MKVNEKKLTGPKFIICEVNVRGVGTIPRSWHHFYSYPRPDIHAIFGVDLVDGGSQFFNGGLMIQETHIILISLLGMTGEILASQDFNETKNSRMVYETRMVHTRVLKTIVLQCLQVAGPWSGKESYMTLKKKLPICPTYKRSEVFMYL